MVSSSASSSRTTVEEFHGTQLPPDWEWFFSPSQRESLSQPTPSCPSVPPAPPSEADEGYTHTLLFATYTCLTPAWGTTAWGGRYKPARIDTSLILGKKLRGFGRGTYNGVGGKIDTASNETPLACILRETHEEIGIHLSATQVLFTGRIRIDVDEGEKVNMAVYRAHMTQRQLNKMLPSWEEVRPRPHGGHKLQMEEVRPRPHGICSIEVEEGKAVGKEKLEAARVRMDRLPTNKLRPEHKVYLALLLQFQLQESLAEWQAEREGDVGECGPVLSGELLQGPGAKGQEEKMEGVGGEGMLFDLEVQFRPEPKKEDLDEGERPENHRTVREWHLKVYNANTSAKKTQTNPQTG